MWLAILKVSAICKYTGYTRLSFFPSDKKLRFSPVMCNECGTSSSVFSNHLRLLRYKEITQWWSDLCTWISNTSWCM